MQYLFLNLLEVMDIEKEPPKKLEALRNSIKMLDLE